MSGNIIKLKKVKKLVKFAHPHETFINLGKKAEQIKESQRLITEPPKRRKPRTISKTNKTNKSAIIKPCIASNSDQYVFQPNMIIRKITENILMLSKEIENIISHKPATTLSPSYGRKSCTPPPGFKITKQSFPNYELKFPRLKNTFAD